MWVIHFFVIHLYYVTKVYIKYSFFNEIFPHPSIDKKLSKSNVFTAAIRIAMFIRKWTWVKFKRLAVNDMNFIYYINRKEGKSVARCSRSHKNNASLDYQKGESRRRKLFMNLCQNRATRFRVLAISEF